MVQYSPRRNIGLRTFYDPLNPPDPAPTAPQRSGNPQLSAMAGPAPPAYSPGGGEMPVVGNPQLGAWQVDQASGNPQLSAMSPPETVPIYEPGGGEMPPPNYEPGGGQEVYGAAGYAMPAWTPPAPPARPNGLGATLAGAVKPASVPYPPPRPAAPAAAAAPSSPFISIDRQNSGPNDRFRGGGTALDLSGLLGGLFGRK